MSRLDEVLGQLPFILDSIMYGVNWGISTGFSYNDTRAEAANKVYKEIRDLAANGISDSAQLANSLKLYAERLWCVIFYLATLYENKDYRPHESGLLNCQSVVFYLDTVKKNLSAIIGDAETTSDKLAGDGNTIRAERCAGLAKKLDGHKQGLSDIREYINSGKSGL